MEEKIKAIVLKQSDNGENNLVLTLATHRGVIDVLAKGVKKMAAKNRAACQSFVLADYLLAYTSENSRGVLTSGSVISDFGIISNLEAIAVMSVITDVISRHFKNINFFADLIDLLNCYRDNENPWPDFCWLVYQWIDISGIKPEVNYCHECLDTQIVGFSLSGGFVCRNCLNNYDLILDKEKLKLIYYLLKSSRKDKSKLRLLSYDWLIAELLVKY